MPAYHVWHTYYITNYMRLVREWFMAGNDNKLVVQPIYISQHVFEVCMYLPLGE